MVYSGRKLIVLPWIYRNCITDSLFIIVHDSFPQKYERWTLTKLFVKWISFYKICKFITFDHRVMCIYLNIICLKQNSIHLVATFIFLGVILTNKNHTVARFRRTQPLTGINKHRPLYFIIHHDPIYSPCTTLLIIYISLI